MPKFSRCVRDLRHRRAGKLVASGQKAGKQVNLHPLVHPSDAFDTSVCTEYQTLDKYWHDVT